MSSDCRIRERTAAMESSKATATSTATSTSASSTNHGSIPPNKHNRRNDANIRNRRKPHSARRKRKKPHGYYGYCGYGRILFLAFSTMFVIFLYGIVLMKYVFVFDSDMNSRLHKRQKEKLGNRLKRDRGQNQDEDKENLEKFLRTKKISKFRRKYPKMIHFLHIHKSAGTFLCRQAFDNKLAIDRKRNCNVRDDQRCCWYDEERKSWNAKIDIQDEAKLLQQSIQFAKNAPFDFVATERELVGPMVTDHYDYVVTLRDSRSRYKSHWQHLVRSAKQRKSDQKRKKSRSRRYRPKASSGYLIAGEHNTRALRKNDIGGSHDRLANTGEDPEMDPGHWNLTVFHHADGLLHPVGNYTKWLEGQPDNYNLRMICGTACLDVPKYQITKDLFEYSLERLWFNFSHILFVEDMDASFARFAKAYGWAQLNKKSGKKKSNKTTADDEKLTHASSFQTVLDDAMYEFALRKYNAYDTTVSHVSVSKPDFSPFQNQMMVDAYFREGRNRNCTNPCCGYCSKW